ncbi:hypothetical protein [uncultured Kriegella sp.]|uniref:hypothetical protein n=1 Tax=uncultured Kriegella sp. TaxID=1798910 RepID=UPI0030D70C87|tara:strand:+ start:106 stop:645 length:540 start_codon:yes stop_codon:yes gene_type:complete
MNYDKLKRLFINKIENEEGIKLKPSEVKFLIEQNSNDPNEYIKIRTLVFNQEFGLGYIDQNSTESDYIKDCFSRLHDYDTDSPKWHIWGLKVAELEDLYSNQLKELKEFISSSKFTLNSENIIIDISDVPSELDFNGLRKYALYVVHNYENILEKEIDIYNYNRDLTIEVIEELKNKIN